jgi:hypothetical protein
LDGDLYFNDSTLADGGGAIIENGQIILYETDATGSESDAQTFVGITANGGTQPDGAYSVQECCGVYPFPLNNSVFNDTDADGFIDEPFDVTLALARDFTIAAGATQTFTTQTLFGNSEPLAPGDTETLPLLPDRTDEVGEVPVYHFEVPILDPGEIIWIDPIVAIGYTYEVTGAEFTHVQAPAFATVPDSDGYRVSVGGQSFSLGVGEILDFAGAGLSSVNRFTLDGIDPALLLDPTSAIAFPLGISLASPSGNTVPASSHYDADHDEYRRQFGASTGSNSFDCGRSSRPSPLWSPLF